MPPVNEDEAETRLAPSRGMVSDELRRQAEADGFGPTPYPMRRPEAPPGHAPWAAFSEGPGSAPAGELMIPSAVQRRMPRLVLLALVLSGFLTLSGLLALAYLAMHGYA
jgi:hypothetical protein